MPKAGRKVLRLPRKKPVKKRTASLESQMAQYNVAHTVWFDDHTMFRVNCPEGTSAQKLLRLIQRGIWAEEVEAYLQENRFDDESQELLGAYPR